MIYIGMMRKTNLRAIDLNLLVVLEVLLAEAHVTRAAKRLAMSQPAVSRALGRLRQLFDDPLLVRGTEGLVLTDRAEQLKLPLAELLAGVSNLLLPRLFVPAQSTASIRLGCLDLEAAVYLSGLVAVIREQAPGMQLDIDSHPDDFFQRLAMGDLHLAISGLEPDAHADQFHRRVIDNSQLECLMRRDHPLASGPMTLDRYLSASHGMVSITGKGPAIMDERLAAQGLSRKLVLRLSSFFNVPDACAQSDLIFVLPGRLAKRLAQHQPLVIRPLPQSLRGDPLPIYLYWHQRQHRDPIHQWLREQVIAAIY